MAYNFMGNDHSNEFDTQDITENKVFAILAYIPILFWLPLACCNQSQYGRFHANQGLLLLITGVVLGVVSAIINALLGWIPVLGWILCGLIKIVVWAIEVGLLIYGMVCTGQGKAKELPGIGSIARLIK